MVVPVGGYFMTSSVYFPDKIREAFGNPAKDEECRFYWIAGFGLSVLGWGNFRTYCVEQVEEAMGVFFNAEILRGP